MYLRVRTQKINNARCRGPIIVVLVLAIRGCVVHGSLQLELGKSWSFRLDFRHLRNPAPLRGSGSRHRH